MKTEEQNRPQAVEGELHREQGEGSLAPASPAWRHTIQAEMAIIRYKQLHTGPKIQLGGFHVGLTRSAYQLGILGGRYDTAQAAAAKQMTMATTRPMHC